MHLDVNTACPPPPLLFFVIPRGPETHDTIGTRPGAPEASEGEAAVARQQKHTTSDPSDKTVEDGPTGVLPVLRAEESLETAAAQQEGTGFNTVDHDAAIPMSGGEGRSLGASDIVAISGQCDHVSIEDAVDQFRGHPDGRRSKGRGGTRSSTTRVGQSKICGCGER